MQGLRIRDFSRLRSLVALFPQPFQHASEIVALEAGAQGRAALVAIEDVGVFGKT